MILADLRDRDAAADILATRAPPGGVPRRRAQALGAERYPGEAVKTNVWGTLAHSADVERFVNISTDKAANPISAPPSLGDLGHGQVEDLRRDRRRRWTRPLAQDPVRRSCRAREGTTRIGE